MQVQTLISNSNNFRYLDRFDDILKVALAMKAQYYYADPITNKIYGFYEENYSLVETVAPFPISNPVFFSGYLIPKDIVNQYKTFFYEESYPYFLFPENRRGDFVNRNIGLRLPDRDIGYGFIDIMTGRELEDSIISFEYDNTFLVQNYFNRIYSYYSRLQTLGQPIVFENMQDNEVIMQVMNNKVSQGAQLLTLSANGKNYGFYVFKSLLGPITKADKLTLIIRPDIVEKNKFMITFSVFKKKSKLEVPELTSMTVDTHAFILNLF